LQARAKYNQEPCIDAVRMIDSWVKSDAVKRYSQPQVQQNNEPAAYRRMVEREQMRTQDMDITWVVRLIWIILYVLFMIFRVANSQSNSTSFNYEAPKRLEIYNSKILDSILQGNYKINSPKDSLKLNLKDIKWQNLN
jgi:hypothetical protein